MLTGLMMDYQLTIDRVLEHGNRLYPHKKIKTKLPDGTLHEYCFHDLYGRVKRLCNVLEGLGVEPGDRVATFAWNNHQHVELYFGAPGAGAVVHTLNIRLFSDQLAYIINHAEDKVIFVDATLLPLIEGLGDQIDSVEHFVLFNGPHGGVETELPGQIHDYETLIAAADDEYSWRVEGENQAMGLCYTSGTTGHPKGCALQPPLDVSAYRGGLPGGRDRTNGKRCRHAGRSPVPRDGVGPALCGYQCRVRTDPARAAHAAVGISRADRNGTGDGRGRSADDLERPLSRSQSEPP